MKSILVRLFGFPATLIHGDTGVLDRWLWLRARLPVTASGSKRLLEVGCGTGAFTVGAALRGYRALGLSWDERNQRVAQQRAALCKADRASFEIFDVRELGSRSDLVRQFDVVICCETIEHILDDKKLVQDISGCLRPEGTLLLTTPNFNYVPITRADNGPFSLVEDGWHVRKGYTEEGLRALCGVAALDVSEVGFCSGFASQKITGLMRVISRIHPVLGWLSVLPLRLLPPSVDPWLSRVSSWPGFSITLVARKQ